MANEVTERSYKHILSLMDDMSEINGDKFDISNPVHQVCGAYEVGKQRGEFHGTLEVLSVIRGVLKLVSPDQPVSPSVRLLELIKKLQNDD